MEEDYRLNDVDPNAPIKYYTDTPCKMQRSLSSITISSNRISKLSETSEIKVS